MESLREAPDWFADDLLLVVNGAVLVRAYVYSEPVALRGGRSAAGRR
ncbi:MAG: hypothetical protein AB1Z67_11795 [Candidatus Limnocylindrales bacterium]